MPRQIIGQKENEIVEKIIKMFVENELTIPQVMVIVFKLMDTALHKSVNNEIELYQNLELLHDNYDTIEASLKRRFHKHKK